MMHVCMKLLRAKNPALLVLTLNSQYSDSVTTQVVNTQTLTCGKPLHPAIGPSSATIRSYNYQETTKNYQETTKKLPRNYTQHGRNELN